MSQEAEKSDPQSPETELGEQEITIRGQGMWTSKAVFGLGVVISLMHIYFNVFAVIPSLWQNALHFSGFVLMGALIYPMFGKGEGKFSIITDIFLGLTGAFSAIYLVAMEDAIYARGVDMVLEELIASTLLILVAIEFTRRTTGWIIPVLIVLALTYIGWWGQLIDGVFRFGGLPPERVLFRSIYGDDALFGNIALISSSFVFMFILFGAFLVRSGAGDFIIDLAQVVAGRTVGGPGLVAVLASGLTGTISGSAVANTASTGVITIPLMKKAGFPAKFAAGVETAASTGGQLMPPIMGAGAFVMASYTQIPYTTIIAVSALPAILYFVSVAFFVRIEAKKNNVQVVAGSSETALEVLKRGGLPFLLPITLLIGLLIYGYTPTYAAGIAIIGVVVASWLTPNKMGPKAVFEALALGARNMVMTAILLCSVGLIVNVIATAGIGNIFSLMINEWAGGNLIIAMILIGLASLVLGMGLPVTAAYIVLGTLSAPALYALISDGMLVDAVASGTLPEGAKAIFMLATPERLAEIGLPMSTEAARELLALVPPDLVNTLREATLSKEVLVYALLSAHMIIFWLSQDSNVTPPVCLTAFTAAAIAKTPPMATGLESWKIAKGLYIVPLLFAYTPFLGGEWHEVLMIFGFSLVGLYAFTGAIQGYMEQKLGWLERGISLVFAGVLLWPLGWMVHLGALALFVLFFIRNVNRKAA
ncbi:TRAP transporter fused permease subunit [Kiloniella laminariae]|uniref:TRAP transporter fused permease subunit n=1 Tax=Kiloniella laminariae TaxID=454162 RepID=A0ABT4LL40_9PROT|nr:TRAP transporter fused permease subunit [Kiloniella laminariae]MCZ4281827.1 TRAP transporter fused permease subunit [Kiloniella laminariae]